MTSRTPERAQFLHDIIATAIEGGVNYWSHVDRVMRTDAPGPDDRLGWAYSSVRLVESPASEGCHDGANVCPGHTVTIETVARGLARITAGPDDPRRIELNRELRRTIRDADEENDAGEIDADGADVIVQAGAFGTVVYG